MPKAIICRYCGRHFAKGLGKHELACSQRLGVEFIPRSRLRGKNSIMNSLDRMNLDNRGVISDRAEFDLEFAKLMLELATKLLNRYTSDTVKKSS